MEIGALLVKTNPVLEAFDTNRNPNLSPSPIPSSNPITQVLEAFGNAVTTLNKVGLWLGLGLRFELGLGLAGSPRVSVRVRALAMRQPH